MTPVLLSATYLERYQWSALYFCVEVAQLCVKSQVTGERQWIYRKDFCAGCCSLPCRMCCTSVLVEEIADDGMSLASAPWGSGSFSTLLNLLK